MPHFWVLIGIPSTEDSDLCTQYGEAMALRCFLSVLGETACSDIILIRGGKYVQKTCSHLRVSSSELRRGD
jgi:hypothetical protein